MSQSRHPYSYDNLLTDTLHLCILDEGPGWREIHAFPLMETARVHHAARRRGGLAAGGARAAAGDASDRVPQPRVVRRLHGPPARIPPRIERHRLCRGSKPSDRIPLGREPARGSATFRDEFSASTQSLRKTILGSLSRIVGNLPLAQMDQNYIKRWMESASTKGVKRTRLLAIRPFLKWACEEMKLIEANPTDGIKAKPPESDGHWTWTDEEIAQYRAHHAIGTKGRLALELILAVAARLRDGISLGRQHYRDGWLIFTQEKNRRRKPVKVEVPVPAELATAIDACPGPAEALTFLTNEWG